MLTARSTLAALASELRRREFKATLVKADDGLSVLLVRAKMPTPGPRTIACRDCRAEIPVRMGPGRPRLLCDACRQPRGVRAERDELVRRAWASSRDERRAWMGLPTTDAHPQTTGGPTNV